MDPDIREAAAEALHAYAFANLVEEERERFPVLGDFDPGPGGNWHQTVPETPAVAYEAIDTAWTLLPATIQEWVRQQPEAGFRLAHSLLGTGAGFDEPGVPSFLEEWMYYVGDDARVYNHMPGSTQPHKAVWVLDTDGLYAVKESA